MKIVVVELFGQSADNWNDICAMSACAWSVAAAEGVHHVDDLLAVAVIGAGDRIMMRDRDQPRPEIDEGEHHALRLQRDRPQCPTAMSHRRLALADLRCRARSSAWLGNDSRRRSGTTRASADDDQQRPTPSTRTSRAVATPAASGSEQPDQRRRADHGQHLRGGPGAGLPEQQQRRGKRRQRPPPMIRRSSSRSPRCARRAGPSRSRR